MFEKNATIAVAVSGGPDSMALLHLLHLSAPRVIALTVEHGLRAESLAEAKAVGSWCKKQKIPHHILPWRGTKPETALHEAARTARYDLLGNFCRKHSILHLVAAHHADDQAETILQRIAKASGPHGLSGMVEHSFTPHLHLWRPLLQVRKSELINYCEENKIPFWRDPSNDNPKYARARLRGTSDILAAEGMTVENLNLLAQKQRSAVEIIESEAAKFLALHAKLIPDARAEISAGAFRMQPAAVRQNAMEYVLKTISGNRAPIRHESIINLCAAITAHGFRAKTLGHCHIASKRICKKDFILIAPELRET